MRFRRFCKTAGQQTGFTLIEMLCALAITGILAVGISNVLFQMLSINAGSSNAMTATKQVENAVDSIRRDALMAQKILPDTANPSGFPLIFVWTTWSNENNVITYSVDSNNELWRTQSVNGDNATKLLAQHITSITVDNYQLGKIELTITSHIDDIKSATETRKFVILQRASQ